ncbi:unnamed protein product [Owenia fusiformis]|uniref:Uncharacterized protein n=1 Tax=Owenia fusiformis TaxID=6347 RepID=A0A8J1XWS4_OWEFU|nr:unnamed protein product [Owenia fusiformis]
MAINNLISVAIAICLVSITTIQGNNGSGRRGAKDHIHIEIDPQDDKSIKEANEDVEHIEDHYDGKVKLDYKSMTTEERLWHFFTQHDFNNDEYLDGLELYHAWGERVSLPNDAHGLDHNSEKYKNSVEKAYERLTAGIDRILSKYDINKDGYLEYVEYLQMGSRGMR